MNPDFSQLYRALALQPGCSLEQFQQAYRRHVASQHPDRPRQDGAGSASGAAGTLLALPDVITLYDQAISFHRLDGRLPGADADMANASAEPAATVRVPAHGNAGLARRAPARTSSRRFPLLVTLALLVLTVAIWQSSSEPTTPQPASIPSSFPSASPAESEQPAVIAGTLMLGMDADTVSAIQGVPMSIRGEQWEYGPSWLRFENGMLVDWYSSPLYRLRTPTDTPRKR